MTLKDILSKGGEGIVIREPGSLYRAGRVSSVLKVKPHYEIEGKMLRPHNTANFLLCELANGENVFVKCSSQDAKNPPAHGTVLTLRHEGIENKKPKFPFYYQRRIDMTWQDVLDDYNQGADSVVK
mmetsp:Transcript_5757/g.6253  ORF Transcript_5757/g.6253 Transcript_5757/m.6253 type:complete len:126 (+) Transcript_5757:1-378(+)